MAKSYLLMGAVEGVRAFDQKFCDRFVWKSDSINAFFARVSQKEELIRGFTRLKSMYDPEKSDIRLFRTLVLVYQLGGKLRSDISTPDLRKWMGADMTRRDLSTLLTNLTSLKAIRSKDENGIVVYSLDADLDELFRFVSGLKESLEFLPHALRLRTPEFLEIRPEFELRTELMKLLMAGRSLSAQDMVESLMFNQDTRGLILAKYSKPDELATEDYVVPRLYKSVSSTLVSLERQGYIVKTVDKGSTKYSWYPKHVDLGKFGDVTLDARVIQSLEAIETNFRNGFFDACAILSRGVVEGALRSLYDASFAPTKCPSGWHLEEMKDALYKGNKIGRELESKVLGLQNLTNPIVHNEVQGIEQSYARSIIEIAQITVKEIYQLISDLGRKNLDSESESGK